MDENLALFTKMLRVGVPEDAVRQLMILRGAGNAGAYQALFGAQAELRAAKAMARTPEQCAFNIDASLSSHYAEELLLKPSSRMYDNLFASTVQYWHVQVKAQTGPTELCEICFNNVSEGLIIKKCQMGVAYCTDCVVEFLEGDITVARVSEHGCACLCRSCDSIFTEDEIKNFVSDETMDKFIKFRNAKLVQVNPLKVYCPNPVCSNVVTLSSETASRAKCKSCNTKFCVKCGGEHGLLMSCDWAADSGFRKWKGTTPDGCKRCPNCRLFIEKDGGCSHMTCQHCNHQFCWRCQSNWSSGCNARRFCGPLSVIRSDVWGSVPVVRESAQVVGITVGSAVGVGLVGAAVGLGAATAAVVVGAGIPVVTVGGTFYAIYQGAKKIKKRYSKRKRMQGRSQTVESLDELSVDEVTDLRNELKWGIRVYYTSNGEHIGNNNGDSFMGIAGRLDEGIFIAYPDLDSRLNGSSPPVYIIQHGTPFDVVNRVAGWSMVEVNVPSAERAEILLDLISADVINQFGLSRGYASIRRLPKNRSFAVTKSVPESDIENYKYLREPTLALHEDLSFAQAYRPRNLSI